MSKKHQTQKNYTSKVDRQLANFDRSHPRSPSQEAEHRKYQRIHSLRDDPLAEDQSKDSTWDQFKE